MALTLGALSNPASACEHYCSFSLDKNALIQLLQSFPDTFIPILFVGKTDIGLEDVLPAEFVNAGEEDCLLVWPKPIIVKGKNLLLMKMWDFNVLETSEYKNENVQRILSVFLAVSAYCVVSFNCTILLHGLRFLQAFYGKLQGEGRHKVLFCVLEQDPEASQSYEKLVAEYESSPDALDTELVSFSEWHASEGFLHRILNRSDILLTQSKETWANALHLSIRFFNIDSDRLFFLQHFPYFNKFQENEELLEALERQQSFLRQASARKFIVRGIDRTCQVDENLDSTLSTCFDKEKPIVVFTVIGGQGLGKSTFLNHLIQRAFKRRFSHPYFEVGNTETHITRDSFIFPYPLPLKNSKSQLILIDLEGLGGMETGNDGEEVMQRNLISGILAISSIPCIIVKNEKTLQKTVEGYISTYVHLSIKFGFKLQRIFFLFQDKDFRQGEHFSNVHMEKWIIDLNKRFFNTIPVIRLVNKPNFENPIKAEMCCAFLDELLADCDYPKLNFSGLILSAAEMFGQLQYITEHSSTNLDVIVPDLTSIDKLTKQKLQQLETESLLLFSTGSFSLVTQFNELYRNLACSMHTLPKNEQRYLRRMLTDKAQEIRQRLLLIEANYSIFREWNGPLIKKQIKRKLTRFFTESIWVGAFLERCETLKSRLNDIARHYLLQKEKISLSFAYLKEKKKNLKMRFIGHYVVLGSLFIGAAGFGLLSLSATYAVTPAIGFGTSAVADVALLFSSKKFITPKSQTLFTVHEGSEDCGGKIEWNASLRLFTNDLEKCVVLIIARQQLPVTEVLSSFVNEVTEFSSGVVRKFRDNEIAQAVSFQYPSRQAEGAMLLLTLKNSSGVAGTPFVADKAIELAVTKLLGHVSVCCLCESEEDDFMLNLFEAASCTTLSLRSKLCLVLRRSLPAGFKDKLQAAIFNANLAPDVIEVGSLDSSEQNNVKLHLSECMQSSRLLARHEVEYAFHELQQVTRGFGLD